MKLENHKVLGSKGILIKLEEFEEKIQKNEAGVYTPLFENYETDGGRPDVKIRIDEFSTIGEIIQISEKAESLLKDELMDLKVGDRVAIYRNHKNPVNEFLVDRSKPVEEFQGYMTIVPAMIQSKII